MISTRLPILTLASLALSACGTSNGAAPAAGASMVAPREARGAEVAAKLCAGCHAVGPAGGSPSAFAPPFRNLRLRYNPISLERHLAEIARAGVYDMPPQGLSASDAEAVAAYIEQLRPEP